MLSYLNFLLFHIWSQWFTYIMALRNASTNHATTQTMPSYFTMYSYNYCIKSAAVHKQYKQNHRTAVIEYIARNYYSSIDS